MPQTRIAFADANWLVAAFHICRESHWVEEWVSTGPSTLIVSGPVLAEAQCNFWRIGNRWPALAADVRMGKYVLCGPSGAIAVTSRAARDVWSLVAGQPSSHT